MRTETTTFAAFFAAISILVADGASLNLTGSIPLPPCVCTRDFVPVCSSNGITYPNQCVLDCDAPAVKLGCQGMCPCKTTPPKVASTRRPFIPRFPTTQLRTTTQRDFVPEPSSTQLNLESTTPEEDDESSSNSTATKRRRTKTKL